jgi:hypothetical protein
MYREAWRIERDWFYDRNTHGFDLKYTVVASMSLALAVPAIGGTH